MDGEWIAVKLYMDEQVLTGSVYLPPEKRLSDLLNGIAARQSERKGDLLELSDVTTFHTDGTKERADTSYINKTNIRVLATLDNDSGRGIVANSNRRAYPFVQKSPVRARMRVPGYELIGTLHCAIGQKVRQVLEEKLMFIPVTDTRIRLANKDTWLRAFFAAVNREQVLFLQHEEISLGS